MAEESQKEVEGIYTRLSRETALRSLLGTEDQRIQTIKDVFGPESSDEGIKLIADALFGMDSNKLARSEMLITEEGSTELIQKANLVRDWMQQNGRLPVGEETDQVDEGGKVIIEDKYWFGVDPEGQSKGYSIAISPALLYAEEDDHEASTIIRTEFGFDQTYQLQISYNRDPQHPQKTSTFYSSKIRPVNQMAQNEAVIINGVLDDFIKDHQISVAPPPTPTQ